MTTQDAVSAVVNCISLKASPSSHSSHISSAVSSLLAVGTHVSVISSSGESVSTSASLLSLASPFLCRLLSSVPCCSSPNIILPDFPTDALRHLINIITNGFTTSHLGNGIFKDINQVMDMAKLLNIGIGDLSYEGRSAESEKSGVDNDKHDETIHIKKEVLEDGDEQMSVFEDTDGLEAEGNFMNKENCMRISRVQGCDESISSLSKIHRNQSPQTYKSSQSLADLLTKEDKNIKASKSSTSETPKVFSCPVCLKNYTRKHNLTQHMNIHSGLKPYKCVTCDKAFSTKQMRIKHFYKYHSESENIQKHLQDKQGHIQIEEKSVNEHVGEHAHDNISSIDKEFIDKKSNEKKLLKIKQIRYKDEKSKLNISQEALEVKENKNNGYLMIHKCDDCSKAFMKEKSLKIHIKKCQKRLKKQEQGLFKAIENVDSTSKLSDKEDNLEFVCDNCGEKFSSQKGLEKHLSLGICFKFQCSFCSEKFKEKDDLDWHIDINHDLSDVD